MAKKNVPITYRKSFLAKYILSDDRVKKVYTDLKNKLMSIKGMKSRISWFYDAFNVGSINFAKLSVRGKYVALYLNLNTKDYPENIYHQEDVHERRRFKDTSFKIHVKSDRTIKYAFRLIDDEIKKFNLKVGQLPKENYYLDYEDEESLVKRGLIQIEKKIQEEPERFVYESDDFVYMDSYVEDEVLEGDEDEEEDFRKIIYVDGSKVFIREKKSFKAKLIQSNSTIQRYYSEIKNQLLSYSKVKARLSWRYEAFSIGKIKLAKLQIRGRHLSLFLNLNLKKYDLKEMGLEDVKKYELFEDTPLLIRIKNDDCLQTASQLIKDLKYRFLLDEGLFRENHQYTFDYMSDEELKEKGLIKSYCKLGEYSSQKEEKFVKEKKSRQNNNFPVYKEEERLVFKINDENEFVNEIEIVKTLVEGIKDIVYLDDIERLYSDNELVDLKSLKAKHLIERDVRYIKIVYRGGNFTKKLRIIANAYSPVAKKAIEDAGSIPDLEVLK